MSPTGGIVTASDPSIAAFPRKAAYDPANTIGREISHEELIQYAPKLSGVVAAVEPTENVMFGPAGRDIMPASQPERQVTDIVGALARLPGLEFP